MSADSEQRKCPFCLELISGTLKVCPKCFARIKPTIISKVTKTIKSSKPSLNKIISVFKFNFKEIFTQYKLHIVGILLIFIGAGLFFALRSDTSQRYMKKGDDAHNRKDFSTAFAWYCKAAEKGNVKGQYEVGNCYLNGQGVSQDYEEAVKWFRQAAEQGHMDAQHNLGNLYYIGQGVAKDDVEAVKWYRKAAEQGIGHAQYLLGANYSIGRGVSQDHVKAVEWYHKAAEQGEVDAQHVLGWYYDNGRGIPVNHVEAVKWYRKAAEQGHKVAQNNLGVCYDEGKGVVQNNAEAVKWYRKAAEQGYAVAQYSLAFCYETGQGIAQNNDEAMKWYRKAADQGDLQAKKDFNRINAKQTKIAQGSVNKQNDSNRQTHLNEDEIKSLTEAAKKGSIQSQALLGILCTRKGMYEAAVVWFRMAAEQGDAFSQTRLCQLYLDGKGVSESFTEAARYARMAAEQGNPYGQALLGVFYYYGRGVDKNTAEGIRLLRKAAEQGDELAIEALRKEGL